MGSGRISPIQDLLYELRQRAFVVELGILVGLLVVFSVFRIAVDAVLDPYFLDSDTSLTVVRGVLLLAGLGGLTASYASWREYSLSVSLPERRDGWLLGALVAGSAVLAAIPFFLDVLRWEIGPGLMAATVSDVSSLFYTRTVIRLAFFVSGMALLYHGFVQEAFGRMFDHDRGVGILTTTLLGGYLVAPGVPGYGYVHEPWFSFWGERAVVAALFVLAVGTAVYASEQSDDSRLRALAMVPLLLTLALAGVVLVSGVHSLQGVLVLLTRVAVVGVAAVAYDATDSLVTPALAYGTFGIVSIVAFSITVDAIAAAV